MYHPEQTTDDSSSQNQIIFSDQQINKMILSSNVSPSSFYIVQPNFVQKKVAVALKNKQGKKIRTQEGQLIVVEKKMLIFEGFLQKKILFPVENIFNDTLPSSFLSDHDVQVARSAYSLIANCLAAMINQKKDYSGFIAKMDFENKSIGITAKGRNGVAPLTAKTNINKGESIERLVQEQKVQTQLEKESKEGIFARFFGGR